ncbi:hypothetical protein JKP88DRAFT_296755 [Tribonema minus]|uniref:Laminin EGF-like domain-containing protein n=1 Tax=Tribonema minus TaxID=303371 RepID=A0A836CLH0_9STRA|nr:hypothetical protein JKP88DRAFT_296755 [Tribonema minus]
MSIPTYPTRQVCCLPPSKSGALATTTVETYTTNVISAVTNLVDLDDDNSLPTPVKNPPAPDVVADPLECTDGMVLDPATTTCACNKGSGGENCEECGANAYAPGGDLRACQTCAANMSPNSDSNGCVCNDGHIPSEEGPEAGCTPCPKGKYQDGNECTLCGSGEIAEVTGSTACTACSPTLVANAERTQCACNKGSGGENCEECGANAYAPGGDLRACQTCAANMSPNSDSNGCVCNDGHIPSEEGPEAGCTPCPKGKYQDGNECTLCGSGEIAEVTGSTACTACSPTLVANAERTQCACNKGSGGENCEECGANAYAPGGDLRACQTCAANMSPNSDSNGCVCNDGHIPSEEGPEAGCTPCPKGKYQDGNECTLCGSGEIAEVTGSTACTACSPTLVANAERTQCACNKGSGGENCEECGANAYAPGGDLRACQTCAANMSPNSDSNGCVCNDGHIPSEEGPEAGCTPCPKGKYQDGNECTLCGSGEIAEVTGSTACTACSPTLVANAERTQCAGYGGTPCAVCQPGSWSDAAMQTCTPCTDNDISGTGATARTPCPLHATANEGHTACACNKGSGGKNCEECGANAYAPGGDLRACQTCAANMSPNSDSNGCVCNDGHIPSEEGPEAGCTPCPKGKYQDGNECTLCGSGEIAEVTGSTACTACSPTLVANAERTQCACNKGSGGENCEECGANAYAPGGDLRACQTCAANMSPNSDSNGCVCNDGHIPSEEGPEAGCTPCPKGKYQDGNECTLCGSGEIAEVTGSTACTACSPTLVANAERTQCACNKGSGGENCEECGANAYAPGGDLRACQTCAANMSPNSDSNGCVCNDGHIPSEEGPEAGCTPCPKGKYQDGNECTLCGSGEIAEVTGSTACTACSPTLVANAERTQCACNKGSGGENCEECGANAYAPGGDLRACQTCAANMSPNSDSNGCVCNDGHIPSEEGPEAGCTPCPKGKYQDGNECTLCGSGEIAEVTGSTACTACSPTLVANAERTQCACNKGSGGENCEECGANAYAPGGDLRACQTCAANMSPNSDSNGCVCNDGHIPSEEGPEAGCTPCPKGKYQDGNECTLCGSGEIAEVTGSTACTACSPTLVANAERTQCACNKGSGGENCEECGANAYAPGGDLRACQTCAANMSPNSDSNGCVCNDGHIPSEEGPEAGCTPCPKGKYQDGNECTLCGSGEIAEVTGSTACTACSPTLVANAERTQCACNKGSGGENCEECGANAYAPGGDLRACQTCAANMSPNSDSNGCVCNDGHIPSEEGPEAGCTPCPKGKYQDGNECTLCGSGEIAEVTGSTACTACSPTLVANAERTQCACNKGSGGENCEECGANAYAPGGDLRACQTCAANMSPNSDSNGCVCNDGHIPSEEGPEAGCTPCPKGKYQDGNKCTLCGSGEIAEVTGSTACTACSPTLVANAERTQCACDKGFGGSDCAQCAADAYSPGGTDLNACTKCEPNMKANDDSNGCVCNAGYVPARLGGKGCTACPAGTYEDTGVCKACAKGKIAESAGSSQCTACPALSVPNAARTQCVCKAGYGRAPGSSSCTACPAGTYSDATMITCKQCQTDRISAAKASVCVACTGGKVANVGQTKCVCKDGQGGATCKKCNVGNYSNASTNYLCVPCATGITPASGAAKCTECAANKIADATRTACVCLDGYGSDASGDCAQCKAGQYSSADTNPPHTCQNCDLESIASAAGSATCATCETSKIPNALHTVCVPPGSEDGAAYKLQTVITGDASCMSYDAAGALTMQPCSADAASQKFVWTWTIPEANPANAYGLLKSGALCADFTGGTTLSAVKMKACKTAANQSQRWTNARVLCADGECTWQFGNRAAPTAADAAVRLLVKTPSLSGSAKVVMGAPTMPGTNAEWFFRKW